MVPFISVKLWQSGQWTVPTAEIKNWCKKVSGRTRRDISQSAVSGEWWVVGPLAGRMLIWRWRLGLWWWRLTSGDGNYLTRIWHISQGNFLRRRPDAKKVDSEFFQTFIFHIKLSISGKVHVTGDMELWWWGSEGLGNGPPLGELSDLEEGHRQ